MASHRSQKLKVYGGAEVDKLDNGRFRVTIRCEHDNNTEGWFEKYREDTFPEFDTLASAGFGTDPASAYDDQYYADLRLISASLQYIPQKPTPVVEFVYETLTSTWTNEVDDVEASTENGLRTLERTQVARPGTAAPYDEDDVGVSTITSNGKTLYLAGFQDASTDRVGRFVSRWAEAGIINVSTPKVGGQQQVVVSAFVLSDTDVASALSDVTASHELVSVSKGNYEGFQTLDYTFEVDSFDVRSRAENDLLVITRTDLSTVSFSDRDVGTSSISDGGGSTLYLSSEEIDNGNTIKKRVARWMKPGIVSEEIVLLDGGLRQVSRVSFYDKNVPSVGILVRDKKENYNGYPVWSTVTIQTSTGGDPTEGTALTYSTYAPFQYPGIATAVSDTLTLDTVREVYDVELDAPVTAEIEATVTITYQTSASIGALPYTYWNPKQWAKLEAKWLTNGVEPTSVYRSLPNYRVGDTATVSYTGGATQVSFLGQFVYTLGGIAVATITLSGGPEDPIGNTYVIQRPTLEEAFVDVDGTQYYRKTTIHATIPAQS